MVSTRGGARTGSDEPAETELKLRKKPVRKAAATTKTKAAPAAKTTRSKKIERGHEDEAADELQNDETTAASKVTRKARAKKDDVSTTTTTARTSKPAAATRARTAATNTASKGRPTRTANSDETATETPDLPPPTQPRAARATRATASTRATAAKEKVAPLSPKKITQVSKAPARSTRNTNAKASSGKEDGKAAAKGKPATRRRGVSDENADVPKLSPSTAEQQAEEVKPKQTLQSKPSARKPAAKAAPEPETIEVDNDTPMSTRPTTPADSPQPGHSDDENDGSEHGIEDVESDDGAEIEISADELCGPKTPMKRLSPRERSKYESAQKDRLAEDVPMKTPARRFQVLGSQGGTPQTQKPYCKPSLPMSEVRPMTVARACDRAMVFPKLQPLALPRALKEAEETADGETTITDMEPSEMSNDISEGGDEATQPVDSQHSLTPAQAAVSIDGNDDSYLEDCEDTPTDVTTVSIEKHDNIEIPFQMEGLSNTDVSVEVEDEDETENAKEDAPNETFGEFNNVTIPFEMKDLSIVDVDGEIEDEADHAGSEDPNETIVMDEPDIGNNLNSQIDASLESEESVIVRHDMAPQSDESFTCDDSMEDSLLPTTTPKPETIVWENLREDVTIPFNFDSILPASRTSSSHEPDEPLNLACEERATAEGGSEVMEGVADEPSMSDVDMDMTLANTQYQRQSFGDVRLSVDATVNLSDFLDMSSLAEQPGPKIPSQAIIDQEDVDMDGTQAETNEDDHSHDLPVVMSPQHSATPAKTPSTPARETMPALPSVPQQEPQQMPELNTPHYAMPTIAFRRKSLPAIVYHTPMKNGARPKTSDGASIARIANPFVNLSAAQDQSQQGMTPFRRRLSMAQGSGSDSRPQTPSVGTPAESASRKTPRSSGRASMAATPRTSQTLRTSQTPRRSHTPRTSSRLSVRPTPKERFPGLPPRQTYEELASTPTAKTPTQSVPSTAKSSIKERFPALPPAEQYEDLVKTPTSDHASEAASSTPQIDQLSTPAVQQKERYPGLPHRRTYEEHARTAVPASRFRTPSQSPAKRPVTVQKPASLRKVALRASGSHTPVKTPLRAPAMTPGQVPLTPHPGAPLKGVNAYVDIFLNDGSSANSTYIAVLHSLGAKTTKTFNDRVTHVVFKEGSPATMQRLRLHNKQVMDSGKGKPIFCVNGRWVNDSNSEGARMDEDDEAYAVDVDDQRASKRRRKSMEPTSLLNIGGNVVRDTSRKSSLGRSSLGRALKADSPSVESPSMSMSNDNAEKENSVDSSFGDESPATPAYLAAPDSLVQQTAPMNRVKKLDFDAQEQAKNRRLTFWDGGEF